MIELTFEEGTFKGASRWEEITLDQFIRISEVEIPSRLREILGAATAMNEEDDDKRKKAEKEYEKIANAVTTRELVQTFPQYYGELMSIATDVPKDIIERIDSTLRTEFFDNYLRYIVLSIFYTQPVRMDEEEKTMAPYFPEKEIREFELRDTIYKLPTTLKLYGSEIFLADEPIVSFAEASEIELAYRELLEKGVNRMPMFIAIYCRPEGEQYNEQKVLHREPLMKQLTMDVVWSVFFCIGKLVGRSSLSIPEYLRKATHLIREI